LYTNSGPPVKSMNCRIRIGFFALMSLAGWCVLTALVPPRDFSSLQSSSPADAASTEKGEHTLLFVGDVMLSRGVGSRMEAQRDWKLPFKAIANTLRNADLRYCNLECPVSDRGRNLHHLYSFRADPRALEGLKAAGFNVVSQANNHAYDWGPQALMDSLERMRAEGIHPLGAGLNSMAAHYPVLVTVGGLRLAFLAYVDVEPKEASAGVGRPGVAWLNPAQALADIRFARLLADLVIVCPHWGVEYAFMPAQDQVELAHQMIDAGADMVVGSHPHVVQMVEVYHNRCIAYSLGNFVFDQKNPITHRGLMLKVTIQDKQIVNVVPIPININSSFQAVLAPPQEGPRKPILTEGQSILLPAK
jgi:poly-gamma-glutamate capsule biosynthesis protein CapA/YwtB (metallophosphatase superfamily)